MSTFSLLINAGLFHSLKAATYSFHIYQTEAVEHVLITPMGNKNRDNEDYGVFLQL